LGVVLYEALTGRQPYSGDTPLALAHAVLSKEAVPLRRLRPDIEAGLAAAVERAMDKTPERRFGDASEMAASLTTPPAGAAGKDPSSITETVAHGELTRPLAVGSTQRLPMAPVTAVPGADQAADQAAGPPRRHHPSRLVAIVAAVVIAAMALAGLAVRDQGSPGDEPASSAVPTTVPPASGSLPPPLEDALRRLEDTVRP
ncbi:MAG TPA: hypothetical protein VGV93_10515, partial [Acidimicrobiales bacterium]|nr:hypothetical protein [Acidimicrobiales bacterium]